MTDVLRLLAVHRYAVYFGGLAVIVAPTVLARAGVDVPRSVRVAVVVVALGLMIATYAGERRLRREGTLDAAEPDAAADVDGRFGRRAQVAFALGLVGVAAGVYVALTVDLLVGGLFVIGALLFARTAVRRAGGDTT